MTAARILLYSDDRAVREQVRLTLGRTLDGRELDIYDVATHQAVIKAVDNATFDLLILDGEAVPYGGMGLCHQLKSELDDCPPVLLLVARVADAWLATWSAADAISAYPIDPVRLPDDVARLLAARQDASA
jgi:DNA-binding response OmpR family regulator